MGENNLPITGEVPGKPGLWTILGYGQAVSLQDRCWATPLPAASSDSPRLNSPLSVLPPQCDGGSRVTDGLVEAESLPGVCDRINEHRRSRADGDGLLPWRCESTGRQAQLEFEPISVPPVRFLSS
jgi:hypothetical protein